jgi:two-component system sensor histidine kinase YesM
MLLREGGFLLKAITSFFLVRFIQRSIYRKMLLSFFSISVLTVSILVTDFYFRTAPDLKRQSVETMERLTQQSAATLNVYLNNVRNFSWNYFGDAAFRQFVLHLGSDPDALSTYRGKFTQFVSDNPIVSSVIVTTLDGFAMRTGNWTPDTPQEDRKRLMNLAIEENGKGIWVPSLTYHIESKTSVETMTFVQAIRNISVSSPGPVIGVMMFDMSYLSLKQWLQNVEGDGLNRTYIVNAIDGKIVFSIRDHEDSQSLLNTVQLEGIKDSQGGHFYGKDDDGASLVVYQKLTNTDWMLVSTSSMQALNKPVNDFTMRTIIIGTLSLLVSMLLASVFSSRTITPLKELSKGMKAIEGGNYKVSLPIRSQDEVGYISASFNRMAREINHLIMKVYETELVKKNAEIKTLQSQINPHFLYNTLGIIDSLSSIEGDGRVSYISRSLARMFRYNISGEDISTLEAEIQQIRLYLSIQKIRFDTRFDYSIYLEPGLEMIAIPKLLFQPLVENSILHGVSLSREGGTVRVEIIRDDEDNVQIRIWNNGVPIDPERQKWLRNMLQEKVKNGEPYAERSSIGLLNVNTRIKLLYGDHYGLDFESSEELGTVFTLTIMPTLPQGGKDE